jgi:hypothetical protein
MQCFEKWSRPKCRAVSYGSAELQSRIQLFEREALQPGAGEYDLFDLFPTPAPQVARIGVAFGIVTASSLEDCGKPGRHHGKGFGILSCSLRVRQELLTIFTAPAFPFFFDRGARRGFSHKNYAPFTSPSGKTQGGFNRRELDLYFRQHRSAAKWGTQTKRVKVWYPRDGLTAKERKNRKKPA